MPTDKELLKNYWDAHAQFGPFDIGPEEHLRWCREAEGQGKTYTPTTEVDLTNHHPCPVCRRIWTDQPLCTYCQETAALRKEIINLRVRLDFLLCASRAVVKRWDSNDWKNTEHTGVTMGHLRAALATAEEEQP